MSEKILKIFVIVIQLVLLVAIVTFLIAYQIPQSRLLHKRLDCVKHGFFDYIEETDECRTLYYTTKAPYQKVKDDEIFGTHCDILEDCVKLRENTIRETDGGRT